MGKASGGIEADTADYRINTPRRSARASKRCDQRASAAVGYLAEYEHESGRQHGAVHYRVPRASGALHLT